MSTKPATACLICGMLLGSAVALAQDSGADRSHPKAFVKDSVIITKIKGKLAAEHITSLGRIAIVIIILNLIRGRRGLWRRTKPLRK